MEVALQETRKIADVVAFGPELFPLQFVEIGCYFVFFVSDDPLEDSSGGVLMLDDFEFLAEGYRSIGLAEIFLPFLFRSRYA